MIAFRFPFAVGLGAVLSLGLFFVLWGFISRPLAVAPATKATVVDFRRLRVDTPPETKRREKVQHEPAPVVPEVPTIGMGSGSEGSVFSLPKGNPVPSIETGRGLGTRLSADPVPLVRVSPDYPPSALARSIEGWVRVQFTIAATGTVRDTKVVAADPRGIFDQAALRAVARWRYSPMIDQGQPIERVGLQAVIRFQLEH